MTDDPADLTNLPPMGPIGKGDNWRSRMYRHNRKVLARRMKLIAEAKRQKDRNGAEE